MEINEIKKFFNTLLQPSAWFWPGLNRLNKYTYWLFGAYFALSATQALPIMFAQSAFLAGFTALATITWPVALICLTLSSLIILRKILKENEGIAEALGLKRNRKILLVLVGSTLSISLQFIPGLFLGTGFAAGSIVLASVAWPATIAGLAISLSLLLYKKYKDTIKENKLAQQSYIFELTESSSLPEDERLALATTTKASCDKIKYSAEFIIIPAIFIASLFTGVSGKNLLPILAGSYFTARLTNIPRATIKLIHGMHARNANRSIKKVAASLEIIAQKTGITNINNKQKIEILARKTLREKEAFTNKIVITLGVTAYFMLFTSLLYNDFNLFNLARLIGGAAIVLGSTHLMDVWTGFSNRTVNYLFTNSSIEYAKLSCPYQTSTTSFAKVTQDAKQNPSIKETEVLEDDLRVFQTQQRAQALEAKHDKDDSTHYPKYTPPTTKTKPEQKT